MAHDIRGLGCVLVADDDQLITQLIVAHLTLEGFNATRAANWRDFLDKASAIVPDVIILDAIMPDPDGWKTVIQLLASVDASRVKLVLMIAGTQENDVLYEAHIGVDAYLAKPFDAAEMIRVVRELTGATPAMFS